MKTRKKIIYIVLFALLAVMILLSAYNYYRKLKQPITPVITAIPADALLFSEFNNVTDLWNANNASNKIWQGLQELPFFTNANKDIIFINTIVNSNTDIKDIFSTNKSYLSLHSLNDTSLALLYFTNVPAFFDDTDIKNVLKDAGIKDINQRKFENEYIFSVKSDPDATAYHYCVCKGVFISSYCVQLLEKSITQLNSNTSIENDKNFINLKATAGKKVDANIYINYANLSKWLASFINKETAIDMLLLTDFGKWTELDMFVKNNRLLLNGYTSAGNINPSYVSIFEGEPAQEMQITSILPQSTFFFADANFSNYATYHARYKNFLKENGKLPDYETKRSDLDAQVGFNIRDNFIEWMGKEFAVAVLQSKGNFAENTFVICHVSDVETADLCLQAIATASQQKDNENEAPIVDKNKIQLPDFLKTMLGGTCPAFNETWFEVANEFVIFGASKQAIKNYKEAYTLGRTLAKSRDYAEYTANISSKSNIYAYINLDLAANYLMNLMTTSNVPAFRNIFPVLQGFHKVSFQLSAEGKRFYTTVNLKFEKNKTLNAIESPVVVQPMSSESEIILDANVVSRPYIVNNTYDKEKSTVIFDDSDKMYLIGENGVIKWKIKIDGKPKSDVYEVDCLKNNKIQYLFNTEKSIYLIDAKGNRVWNYPIKLPSKATSGLALIDYESKRNYRVAIAGKNRKIHYFNIKGETVRGFKSPVTKDIVEMPLQHIVFRNKDYIIITDKSGNMKILNRKGKERLRLKTPFAKNTASKFYCDGKSLITTDKDGNLRYISFNGKVETKTFESVLGNHTFVYEDFDNDGDKDFIFLTSTELSVYKEDGSVIFNHKFDKVVIPDLRFYANTQRGSLIAILGKDNKQLYVFNKDGLLDESIMFKGETLPDIVPSLDKERLNLYTGYGNKLLKYTFQ